MPAASAAVLAVPAVRRERGIPVALFRNGTKKVKLNDRDLGPLDALMISALLQVAD